MSDKTTVHIGENSAEEVAFKLFGIIASVENRELYGHGKRPVDREYVLRTYAQCLQVAKMPGLIEDILKSYPHN